MIKKTLPNGITQQQIFDDTGRLTQIDYKKTDGSPIDTLTYTYQDNDRRASKTSGISTSTSVQETPLRASYNDANQLISLTLQPDSANAKAIPCSTTTTATAQQTRDRQPPKRHDIYLGCQKPPDH